MCKNFGASHSKNDSPKHGHLLRFRKRNRRKFNAFILKIIIKLRVKMCLNTKKAKSEHHSNHIILQCEKIERPSHKICNKTRVVLTTSAWKSLPKQLSKKKNLRWSNRKAEAVTFCWWHTNYSYKTHKLHYNWLEQKMNIIKLEDTKLACKI